VIIPEVVSIQL